MYDRRRQEQGRQRKSCSCEVVEKRMSQATLVACRLIFEAAFEASRWVLAPQVLAFTVVDALHSRTAVVATVRGRRTGRFSHRLVTSGPIAKNFRMFFCCVTTRRLGGSGTLGGAPSTLGAGRCGLAFLPHVGLRRLVFPSLPFCLGMFLASFKAGAAFLLPLGCLPATHRFRAFRFLAVALVVPPCLKSPPAVLAKTGSPPQPPTPGTPPTFFAMLNMSHGR